MKFFAKILSTLLYTLLTVSCGSSVDPANDQLKSKAPWTTICTAKDLFSGKSYTKYSRDESKARHDALDECYTKTGNVCTATCVDDDITGGAEKDTWFCVVADVKTDRSWARTGASYNEARENAMNYCEKNKAGVQCQITKCGLGG